ncbi:MAG: DUF3606 domain-containing protein [Rhodospirillaceae bacterium]|nr:DUF3606 domain-containing protein [Rhodospirillaceae bacterium]
MTTASMMRPVAIALVNIADPYHVYRWCRRWGVTETQLRAAVRAVGREARAVEAALLRAKAPPRILASETRLREDRTAGDD